MQYEEFAMIYDWLMDEVPYDEWLVFIEEKIAMYYPDKEKSEVLVADIGCGTGNLTLPMAISGYNMIGIDLSEDMLMIAREKMMEADLDILFLHQDMTQMELFGTCDMMLATCDSLNYLSSIEVLRNFFKQVKKYLNPGGLFIFDMNTSYQFAEIYGNQSFHYTDEGIAYIWENEYDTLEGSNHYMITFFVENDEGLYERFDEEHYEYAYDKELIEELVNEAGLTIEGVYDNYTRTPYHDKTQRMTFVVVNGER